MSITYLKSALLSTALIAGALSGAEKNKDIYAVEIDDIGFLKEPACGFHENIKKYLEVLSGQTPSGIKASNDKWDMEIYSNPQKNTWTLVGKSRAPGAKNKFQLCYLAQDAANEPYAGQKWYELYFKSDANTGEQK